MTRGGYRVKQTGALQTELPTLKLSSLLSFDSGASVLDAAASQTQDPAARPQLTLFVFSSADRARPFADQLRIDAHRFFANRGAGSDQKHPEALVGTGDRAVVVLSRGHLPDAQRQLLTDSCKLGKLQ